MIMQSGRLKLSLIFILMYAVWAADVIGYYFQRVFSQGSKVGLYFYIVLSLFTGYLLESGNVSIYKLPDIYSPPSADVLGGFSKRDLNYPKLVGEIPFPSVSASSIYAVEIGSGRVLVDKDSRKPLPPASATKLMTALVALDVYSPDEKLRVPYFCTTVEGQRVGFYADEEQTVGNLIYSLLVNSSGDAACTLASSDKVSYEEFIGRMNKKASDIGLLVTYFSNPIGLDGDDHISSSYDLFLLAKEVMENDLLGDVVKTKEKEIWDVSGKISRKLRNTNNLLWNVQGTIGIKTGKTEAAGEVLVYRYKLDNKDIVLVVMGSADRFRDTEIILDWMLSSYSWDS